MGCNAYILWAGEGPSCPMSVSFLPLEDELLFAAWSASTTERQVNFLCKNKFVRVIHTSVHSGCHLQDVPRGFFSICCCCNLPLSSWRGGKNVNSAANTNLGSFFSTKHSLMFELLTQLLVERREEYSPGSEFTNWSNFDKRIS